MRMHTRATVRGARMIVRPARTAEAGARACPSCGCTPERPCAVLISRDPALHMIFWKALEYGDVPRAEPPEAWSLLFGPGSEVEFGVCVSAGLLGLRVCSQCRPT